MRIGIDVRPLQLEAYKERGIGTHLRGWIKAAQSLPPSADFFLLFDPSLPRPDIALSSSHWQLQPFTLPLADSDTYDQTDPGNEFLFDSAIEAFLLDHQFDLFHATYTLMREAFASRRIYHTRWVVTFYDLIPLLFRDEYLQPLRERDRRSFAQRLGAAVYAQRVQTLSRTSQMDLANVTGLSPEKIDVVHAGVDECFAPLPAEEIEGRISGLGIQHPYIFGVSGSHHTKNLRRLLEAYSLLPDALRRHFQLVILCPLSSEERRAIQRYLAELGIQERVLLLHGVSQPQLAALYNGAAVLLHPTLYEGFGLPIVEAMRCGTPVVTSNTSSMPEIADGAAKLVDPHRPLDIAQGVTEVMQSPALQAEMRERGFQQAAGFTWECTAAAILDSYAKAAEKPLYSLERVFPASFSRQARRLRLAFWTSLTPHPSGISDYSESLIAELGKLADVEVFLDGYQPSNLPLFDSFPMFDGHAYLHIARRRPYDMNLYQVADGLQPSTMHETMLNRPGIVTLHDSCLAHTTFSDKRLITASRGIVVHSQWGRQQVEQYTQASPIRVIPFGAPSLEDDGGRFARLARRLLGIPQDSFVFGVFGSLSLAQRIPIILRAFSRVHERRPDAVLLMAGPVDASAAGTLRTVRCDLQTAHAQGMYLYQADPGLLLLEMPVADVGIDLCYPADGEGKRTRSALLGQGTPTIVSGAGSCADYPDDCCPKVPAGSGEEDALYAHMLAAIEDEAGYRRAVQAARAYSRDKTWYHCAQQHLDFIEQVLSGTPNRIDHA